MPTKIPKPWLREGRGWYVTISGQQFPLGHEREAAFAEYHRLMQRPAETRQVSSLSFASIADDFLTFVGKNKAKDTFEFYRDLLQKFCALHGSMRADQLKPFHVQSWVDGYEHLSRNSRRNHLRAVKRCMKWAKKMGYLDSNPIEDMELPAAESREVLVSDAEYRHLLEMASPQSLKDLIVTTWETGCRPQESLRVRAEHVDVENQRWVIPASEAKGEKIARVVDQPPRVVPASMAALGVRPVGSLEA